MWQGAMTALVTPFREGEVDFERLAANVRVQAEAGIVGVVPCGTTGESPTLSHAEHRRVIEATVEAAAAAGVAAGGSRVKVIAGTGSNSTREAMELTRHAADAGADGALMVNPYYNKPTQEGMVRHFTAVADAVDLPILLYNIPGRCGVALTPATIVRLAQHPNIVGVKEATGSLDIASEVAARCDPERFAIISGDDSLTLPLMSVGGRGVISVLSNLMPERVVALTAAALRDDWREARRLHLELFPLCRGLLTLATNPIPIKAALAATGRDTGELRLPLVELEEGERGALERMLSDAGVG